MFRKEITVFLKNEDVYEGFLDDVLEDRIIVDSPKLIATRNLDKYEDSFFELIFENDEIAFININQ